MEQQVTKTTTFIAAACNHAGLSKAVVAEMAALLGKKAAVRDGEGDPSPSCLTDWTFVDGILTAAAGGFTKHAMVTWDGIGDSLLISVEIPEKRVLGLLGPDGRDAGSAGKCSEMLLKSIAFLHWSGIRVSTFDEWVDLETRICDGWDVVDGLGQEGDVSLQ